MISGLKPQTTLLNTKELTKDLKSSRKSSIEKDLKRQSNRKLTTQSLAFVEIGEQNKTKDLSSNPSNTFQRRTSNFLNIENPKYDSSKGFEDKSIGNPTTTFINEAKRSKKKKLTQKGLQKVFVNTTNINLFHLGKKKEKPKPKIDQYPRIKPKIITKKYIQITTKEPELIAFDFTNEFIEIKEKDKYINELPPKRNIVTKEDVDLKERETPLELEVGFDIKVIKKAVVETLLKLVKNYIKEIEEMKLIKINDLKDAHKIRLKEIQLLIEKIKATKNELNYTAIDLEGDMRNLEKINFDNLTCNLLNKKNNVIKLIKNFLEIIKVLNVKYKFYNKE
jgi:hypothetical protein